MQGYLPTKSARVAQHNEDMLIRLLNHTEQVESGFFNTSQITRSQHNTQMLQQILKILNNSK